MVLTMLNNHQAYILVVDDNPANLLSMELMLKPLGQIVLSAASANEALRLVLQYDFAVILLDVQMPDIDGFETARLIRDREKSSYTPIIFLSAWHKEAIDIHKGYAMGAVDYISKPIDSTILLSKVKVFVDLFTKSVLAVQLQHELKKRIRIEQKLSQQQRQLKLAHLERIRVIEEASSALAHELNQPLAAVANYVKGCIYRLKQNTTKTDELLNALERAGEQAERAGAILHRIKDFARKSKLCLEPVNINEWLSHIPHWIPTDIVEEKIDLQFKLTKKKMPPIWIDKIQFEQALVNLVNNGVEALQQSPKSVRCLMIETELKKSQSVIIKVSDNGPGIPPESLTKLFDLYYSTKIHGMGMGLAICRTIIEAHGGSIMAYNGLKGGACFQVSLPIQDKYAPAIN